MFLIKKSTGFDENIKFEENVNLDKKSNLTKQSNFTKMSNLTKMSMFPPDSPETLILRAPSDLPELTDSPESPDQ